jgi:hypothetical protein
MGTALCMWIYMYVYNMCLYVVYVGVRKLVTGEIRLVLPELLTA